MTDGNRQYGPPDEFRFRDNAFQGPVQGEGVQNNYFGPPPPARAWWRRRTTGAFAALALVLAVAGAYTVYALGSTNNGVPKGIPAPRAVNPGNSNGNTQLPSSVPGPTNSGVPKGIPVTRPVNPGNAKLPSYLHLQAQEQCGSGVHYYAETADDYQRGQHRGQRRLGPAVVDITSQTSSKEAVLLVGMRVLVLQRTAPPATGIAVAEGGCGTGVDVRPFRTDLNKTDSPIIAEAAPPSAMTNSPGHPPVTFPYKISPNDPEVFELTLKNTTCFCAFAVEIDWVAAGKAGKTILSDGGQGFLSGAAPKLPAYTLESTGKLLRTTYPRLFPSSS
jgi:hypothetical protein